jgi:hypothetical protein
VREHKRTECDAWAYVTVVDFFPRPSGAAFEFTYDEDHKTFKYDIEYVLTEMGDSVDAKVGTRVLAATPAGPHLMHSSPRRRQDGVVGVSLRKVQVHEMYDELPNKYRQAWRHGKKVQYPPTKPKQSIRSLIRRRSGHLDDETRSGSGRASSASRAGN